jgi:D-tyrosyl-tRNA(Tyr) deacylase
LRAVVQRVAEARVRVEDDVVGEIGPGLFVLLGVAREDDEVVAERLAGRVARLRIFENEAGKFDRSVLDAGGAALVVSQFTLIADTAKGNRPSFSEVAPPELAEPLYERFCSALRELGVVVETGLRCTDAGRACERRSGDDPAGRLEGSREGREVAVSASCNDGPLAAISIRPFVGTRGTRAAA